MFDGRCKVCTVRQGNRDGICGTCRRVMAQDADRLARVLVTMQERYAKGGYR